MIKSQSAHVIVIVKQHEMQKFRTADSVGERIRTSSFYVLIVIL